MCAANLDANRVRAEKERVICDSKCVPEVFKIAYRGVTGVGREVSAALPFR